MSGQGMSARLARLDLALRSENRLVFGDAVAAPDGWDIILILYLADAEGHRLTGREVIEQAGASAESGKRRIAHLSHLGVIVGDGSGKLDDVVTLAPDAVTRVEELIERAWGRLRAV